MAVFFGIGRRGGQWEINPGAGGRYIKRAARKQPFFMDRSFCQRSAYASTRSVER